MAPIMAHLRQGLKPTVGTMDSVDKKATLVGSLMVAEDCVFPLREGWTLDFVGLFVGELGLWGFFAPDAPEGASGVEAIGAGDIERQAHGALSAIAEAFEANGVALNEAAAVRVEDSQEF